MEEFTNKAENAKTVREKLKELANVVGELEKTEADRKAAEEELKNEKKNEKKAKELENKAAVIEKELSEYDALDKLRTEVTEEKTARETSEEALEANKKRISLLSLDLEKKKNELEGVKDAGENKSETENEIGKQEEEKEKTESFMEEYGKLTALTQELAIAQKNFMNAEKKAAEAKKKADDSRNLFNREQAGIMAEELTDGEPCPVCGSTVHPHKAEKSDKAPDENEVKMLEELAEKASGEYNRLSAAAGVVKGRKETLEKSVKGEMKKLFGDDTLDKAESLADKKLCEIRTSLAEARNALDLIEKKLKQKKELEELIPEIEKKLDEERKITSGLSAETASRKSKQEEKEKQLALLSEKLSYNGRDEASEAVLALKDEAEAISEAIKEAEDRLTELKESEAALGARKKQLERDTKGKENVSYDAAVIEKQQEEARRRKLREREKTLSGMVTNNKNILTSVTMNSETLSEADRKYMWLDAVNRTANGTINGAQKISIETYILQYYFEKILRRATVHMLKMTDGKYDLVLAEEGEGRGQFGLDIDVIDHANGKKRSVKSLSGGESFIASLSLALGLSEEIQASAGGIVIDAMFVDEGFGSLDEDILKQSMNALNSLADGKRLIGIISHVQELSRTIDRQIEVKKDKDGTSTVRIRN